MDFADFLPVFITESKDNLAVFEDNLVQLNVAQAADDEQVNTIFRAIHSIKGGAGMFDAAPLVEVAHKTESVLDRVRNGELVLSSELVDAFFLARDIIEAYLDGLENGQITRHEREGQLLQILSDFRHNPGDAGAATTTAEQPDKPQQTSIQDTNMLIIEAERNAFMMGFRLEPLIVHIEQNHQLISLDIDYDGPPFSELNPIECFVTVNAVISPAMTEEEMEDLLSFSAGAKGRLKDISRLPVDMAEQTITVPSVEQQQESQATDKNEAVDEEVKDNTAQAVVANFKKPKGELIKVNSVKLDRLVDDVGELISLKSQLKALLSEHQDQRINRLLKEFDKSFSDLRDTSLSLRLVPLAETLNRFHRVVREAAKVTEKSIALDIIGGQTELDRITVEKLVDPLTHIIRNSCDHGIEHSDERLACGKDETGQVVIQARYKGSGVSLTISDDGKGLDKDRIFNKAVSNGIVAADEKLSDREIFQLIFHPGLSTAEKVTDLSGRGVGMDVVRRNINQLGGDIIIDSIPGKGTSLEIRLPLTTAILDGFMIKVGDADLVVQMDSIIECMRREELAQCMVRNQNCIELRGDYVPVIYLTDYLHVDSTESQPEGLMVHTQYGNVLLAVDHLQGELQTVVKPLDPILQQSQLFSGIVKMQHGDIGFVLDINTIALKAEQQNHANLAQSRPQA